MRRVLVNAGVFIRLARIGRAELLGGIPGRLELPAVVQLEVADSRAAGVLERAVAGEHRWLRTARDPDEADVRLAAEQLGREGAAGSFAGDVELLAAALDAADPVVLTDDRPLGSTCRVLGIPTAGSIGVTIAAVERGALGADEARAALVAMDEVGPRLSASLFRRAERLVDVAAGRAG